MLHVNGQMEPANDESNTTKMLLRIFVLGPLTIEWEGHHPPFPPERMSGRGAAKALGLLKALLSQADRFAMRDWLMEQFWPESAISSAQERLDDVASGLRTLLRPPGSSAKILQYVHGSDGKGSGYRLEGYPLIWVDADAFAWYVEQAARLDRFGDDSLPCWERAYHLGARGLFLPEERYNDWPQARRAQVEGHYRQCVHRLTTLLRERGAKEQALLRLRSYWQAHPTDEDVLRPLMELLGEQERYQEAEDDYQQLLLALAEQGSGGHPREPDEHTRDLREYLRAKQLRRSPGQEALMKRSKEERSASSSAAQQQTRVVEATGYPLSDDQRLLQMADEHSERTGSLDAETRHLLGRQEWLASVLALIQAEIPKKLLVLHGPIGVGKSSEMNRLAHSFREQNASPFQVLVLPLPSGERHDPEAALDFFVGMILSESRAVPFPADASRQTRITLALTTLAQRRQPTVILLDNAEGTLTEEGTLAPCWEAFLACCVRGQHQATFVLATKEWPGWSGRDSQLVAEIAVPPLTLEDSVLLLQRLGLESVPRAALEMISQRVACIPLCLEWIATIAHDPLVHDEWEGFEEQEETGTESRLDAIAQRLGRLLHHPTLLEEHLASRLTPLLEHIMEKHLSADARQVLEHLAIVSIPLAKLALQVLCPRPALLKELRDVSLLAAYTNRVQLLPMVASTVRQHLSPEQVYEGEELVMRAFARWLEERSINEQEAGSVITELVALQLMHHHLLEAAQLVLYHGWLSFQQGQAQYLARLTECVLSEFHWRATPKTESGGLLLHYFLMSYLGLKENEQERTEDHQQILNYILAGQITLEPLIEVYVVHTILRYYLSEDRFEQAQQLVDACYKRMEEFLETDFELHMTLLSKRAWIFGKWSGYVKGQGMIDEAKRLLTWSIEAYQQCISLLQARKQEATLSPLRKSAIKKKLATFSNNLSYQLNRIGRFEEALAMVEQGIKLKEQGFTDFGALAASYGEKSQILAALGQFQEALRFDEKARVEVQRCADTGDIMSQEEVWMYHVNQGRLSLRLGRIDEAERLLREALPCIHARRKIYRMFAKEALMEIEQMRHSSRPHQLDWRWVERYRELDAFDAYWWWAHAGPFTQEEQQQWDRLFSSDLDEKTKKQLSSLLARSRDREVEAALAERREPHLHYPALAIEEVQRRIADFIQLDQEIQQQEPNAIVRRLYHGTIEDELSFIQAIEATYQGDSARFWELTRWINPAPTREEMNFALLGVRQMIRQGMQRDETRDVSEQVMKIFQEQLHLSLDLSSENDVDQLIPLEGATHSSESKQMLSVQAVRRFFEAALREAGFDGWQVVLDPNANGARIDAAMKLLFLQESPMSLEEVRNCFLHELLGHVWRSEAGERSMLGLLGINTKGYMATEEGLAQYYERIAAAQRGEAFDDSITWFGGLAVGLASGVVTPPQTFSSLFAFFEPFILLYRLLWRYDQDRLTAEKRAHQRAIARCLRTFRGVPDLTQAGICYPKDVVYLRGRLKIERAIAEDETILDRLAVGRVALELLPDLQELGMTTPIQSLRKRAHDPGLDAYILSFQASEELIKAKEGGIQ